MESSKAAEDALSQERRRIMSGLKATTFTPSELDELNQRPEKIKAWLENNDLNSVFLAIVRATSKENRQATIIPLQDKLMRYIAGHTQEIVDLDIKRVRKIADTPGQTTHEYPVATPESIIKTMMIYHPMSAPHQIEGASLPKMLPSYKDLLTTIYPKQSERPIQVTNVIKAINNWSMDINTAFAAAAKFQNEFLRAEIPHNVLRVKESPLQTVVTLQANIASVEDMLPKKTLEGIFSDIDRTPTTTISEKDKSLLKGKLTDYVATNLGQIQTRAKAKLDELAGGKEYSIDSSTKHWRDQDEVFRVLSSNHPIHTPQQALTTQEIKGMLASYKELVETIYANNSESAINY